MLELPKLNLPEYQFNIRCEEKNYKIFDIIRNAFVALTPEEWVRQNVVQHLIDALNFPKNRISNETSILYNKLSKRCDTVIYDSEYQPLAICEYKKPQTDISQKVFDQIAIYNCKLNVPYLLVSNGFFHYFCKVDFEAKRYLFSENLPDYKLLCKS
ncbi:MAG: type I restriction enzyme HsdR N-terminal domain-containing protein [Prevotellaceae bacterium]|jgi:type I site-specific restriction endonuclease|nr:type I restriction enzyme HsdR N-terminal domain-containing protein [Prevotellaceae bacterium]